jgi:hypothetical protein
MLEFSADDPFGRQPEAIPIERERAIEIGDSDRQDGDARFHGGLPGLSEHSGRQGRAQVDRRNRLTALREGAVYMLVKAMETGDTATVMSPALRSWCWRPPRQWPCSRSTGACAAMHSPHEDCR